MFERTHDDSSHPSLLRGIALPHGKSQMKLDGSGIDERYESLVITPTSGFTIKTTTLGSYWNKSNQSTVSPPKSTTINDAATTTIEDLLASSKTQKFFINVCYHQDIEPSSTKKKLNQEGKEVEGINIPLSIGPIRKCDDKKGTTCLAVDAIVHPSVEQNIAQDKTGSQCDFVCQILMQALEQKYNGVKKNASEGMNVDCFGVSQKSPALKLDRKYKLPRMKYFGYVDTKSGEIVRRESEHTVLCKQVIRDISRKPKIEEVAPSANKSSTSCSDDETARMEKEHIAHQRGKKSKKTTETKNIAKESPLLPLRFQFSLRQATGKEITIEDYLQKMSQIDCKKDNSQELDPIPSSWDGSFPLLFDPSSSKDIKSAKDAITITHVVARAVMSPAANEVHLDNISLEMSTYAFYLSSKSLLGWKEYIIPFCVDTQGVNCTYDEKASEMCISAPLLSKNNNSSGDLEDTIDVGSQPWLLARALSVDNDNESKNKKGERKKNGEDLESSKETKEHNEWINFLQQDDPYLLKSQYLRNQSSVLDNTKSNSKSNRKGKIGLQKAGNPLPEDSFHKKDSMSQHVLRRQEEEQQEKATRSEQERKERKSNGSDGSVEYINAEDFRPGGKYFDSAGSDDNEANGIKSRYKQEHQGDVNARNREKAEQIIKNNNDSLFNNDFWYKLS